MALLAGQTHGGAGSTQFCSQRMEVPWYFCPIQPSCCCPPPQQLQLLHLGGKFSVWAPGGQEAAGHGSGWSCLCGWGSCSALLDQESSGQPCPGTWRAVTGVNVWHRNHFGVFGGQTDLAAAGCPLWDVQLWCQFMEEFLPLRSLLYLTKSRYSG